MVEIKMIWFNKVFCEFNILLDCVVEFLGLKGFEVEVRFIIKIFNEEYDVFFNEF